MLRTCRPSRRGVDWNSACVTHSRFTRRRLSRRGVDWNVIMTVVVSPLWVASRVGAWIETSADCASTSRGYSRRPSRRGVESWGQDKWYVESKTIRYTPTYILIKTCECEIRNLTMCCLSAKYNLFHIALARFASRIYICLYSFPPLLLFSFVFLHLIHCQFSDCLFLNLVDSFLFSFLSR